jgi:hypothetical protein
LRSLVNQEKKMPSGQPPVALMKLRELVKIPGMTEKLRTENKDIISQGYSAIWQTPPGVADGQNSKIIYGYKKTDDTGTVTILNAAGDIVKKELPNKTSLVYFADKAGPTGQSMNFDPTAKTENNYVRSATSPEQSTKYEFYPSGKVSYAWNYGSGAGARFDESGNVTNSWNSKEDDSFLSSIAPIAAIGLSLLAPGVGTAIGSALGASGVAATALGNAVIGGTLAEASGGDFVQGALQGAGGALLGSATAPITSAVSEAVGSQALGQALTSGALAEAQGGDFLQGAIAGGISGLANEAKLAAAEEYLKSQPAEYTYESDLPTLNVNPGDTIGIVEQPFIPDTSFTPDYSLSTGPSVVPDMGAQGIKVPTINEVIDVVNKPIDYSLPIPDSGLGLVIPAIPNLDAMGGGQGITVPVTGGTLTEAGVIPESYVPVLGDPESFINQPAPDSGVTISEPTEKPMTQQELESELAKTDLAKTAANLAAGALTAGAVVNAISGGQDTQTGFPIVPVPADWTSPVYANAQWQAPTTIDFGSAQLLEGTQWDSRNIQSPNQYSLSNLINTLNYQSQPFVQSNMEIPQVQMQMPDILSVFQTPSTVGLNDKIGSLNGTPMSIADIIAGIQSGQTYSG